MRDELKKALEDVSVDLKTLPLEERRKRRDEAAARAGITPEKHDQFKALREAFATVTMDDRDVPELIGCSDEALRLFQVWMEIQDLASVGNPEDQFSVGVFIGLATGIELAKNRDEARCDFDCDRCRGE